LVSSIVILSYKLWMP